MSLLFLIPLVISLGLAYLVLENSHDEIAKLAASAAIVSLIVCLLFSPWQLQLLLLMWVVTSTRRFSLPNQNKFR
ncbi:hypothetical protein [Funiculus sociatus]|uniref:hypothetical protein n=1 Tax=Funiculus sociatus TaxID=450527 RepID=UPI0019CC7D11|nr:hypothetical protein [Trichocoleus sp. FACHB-69]